MVSSHSRFCADIKGWLLYVFTGNTAPFHIIEPLADNDVQIFPPTATMATLTCSLNITIPDTVAIVWAHNNNVITMAERVTKTGNTTTLLVENVQPSDAGDYQCAFNDALGSTWTLRRNIRVHIIGKFCINYELVTIICLSIAKIIAFLSFQKSSTRQWIITG